MWSDRLNEVMALPRGQQVAALRRIRTALGDSTQEERNSAFGADRLYEAWSQLPFMQDLYAQNRAVITASLGSRKDWHIIEVGGGNGALWDGYLHTLGAGTFTLIDPNDDAHNAVAAKLPAHVAFRSVRTEAENAEFPAADVVVCSLALRQVAGLDASQRKAVGLTGDGKLEVLQRMVAAVRSRRGIAVMNETDVYNEVGLPPGDAALVDRFIDAYVRRAARAVAAAIDVPGADVQLRMSWDVILRRWCLDQVDLAYAPRGSRDVHELDAARWLGLIYRAGAQHVTHRFTDEWNLFQQYVFG